MGMNNIERRNQGLIYHLGNEVIDEIGESRKRLQRLNQADWSDFERLRQLTADLLGHSEGALITPPFFCDYGTHISVGKNFFANFNCTILDVAKVTIGDNCFMAPNVAIYTAAHPIHPAVRNAGFECAREVTIGDNVWLGGSVVICPGVHIGSNVVIGAGSVVLNDIPDWTVAAGNPCRPIRPITEEDKRFYFRHEEIDDEAWAVITEKIGE